MLHVRLLLGLLGLLLLIGCPTTTPPDDDDATDDDDSAGDDDDATPDPCLPDIDGDGVSVCGPDGIPGNADDDCDDDDDTAFPGNPEVCDGGVDNDCDPTTDENGDGDGDGSTLCDGDCDDDDGANFPGNAEVCDGADNDCDATTSFTGVAFDTGSTVDVSVSGDSWRGNAYRVDGDTTLVSFTQTLSIPAGASLTWQVFESSFPTAGYSVVATATTTVAVANGDVLMAHPSPELNVPMNAGMYYGLGVYWDLVGTYEREGGSAQMTPAPFGMLLTGLLSTLAGAPPAGVDLVESGRAWYAQTVTTTLEDDADGDGFLACVDDCNDGEADAWPGNAEVDCDLVDNDCEAATPDCIGGLVVTELFPDAFGNDANKEWFELYNASVVDIDLDGWLLRDDDGDDLFFDATLVLAPGDYALLASSDDVTLNGGLTPDYPYGSSLSLSNGNDELVLVSPAAEVVDEVLYDDELGWQIQSGSSMNLDPATLDAASNDDAASWCPSFGGAYGTGIDTGTPGAPNVSCAVPASGAVEGDLIVNELLSNPSGADGDKEWFEVFNTTGSDIDLLGWEFSDDDDDLFVVLTSVVVPASGYAVLGKLVDSAVNGGVGVDYQYADSMGLTNTADEIVITSPEGLEIDALAYDTAAGFTSTNGETLSLDPAHADFSSNDSGTFWCDGLTPFGTNGDFGTPGAENDDCFCPDGELFSSSLDASDPTFNRSFGATSCGLSGTGTAVYFEVYEFELVGAGPHDLTVDLCNLATFDTTVAVYQEATGAASPFDSSDACLNRVGFNDDGTGCSLTSYLELTGLVEGDVDVVVSSFGNGTTGAYDVVLSSTTSECTGEGPF